LLDVFNHSHLLCRKMGESCRVLTQGQRRRQTSCLVACVRLGREESS
jgi:hypothetical protein